MISLKRSLPNVNHRAYRCLSGLVGFRRPLEFGLDRPRLSPGAACLGPARWEHCSFLHSKCPPETQTDAQSQSAFPNAIGTTKELSSEHAEQHVMVSNRT